MPRSSTKSLVFCVGFGLAVAGLRGQQSPQSKACFDKALTQMEMNKCAGADADAAESEMNRTYQAILKKYADQPLFMQRLREAQRAWLVFRDAQIEMRFPIAAKESPPARYGSVYPMCHSQYKAQLTQRRTQELEQWLAGIPEGDVCSGSVKTADGLR